MTDKQIKEEIKQVVTNLGNIKFTVEDELEFCKQVLKRKEQECEELKQGYAELTEIVSPYMDDFTGYNEELGGFDIVLCVKELLVQLDQLKGENEELKRFLSKEPLALQALQSGYASYKKSSDVFYELVKQYKQTLTEIKEMIPPPKGAKLHLVFEEILKKISECGGNDENN